MRVNTRTIKETAYQMHQLISQREEFYIYKTEGSWWISTNKPGVPSVHYDGYEYLESAEAIEGNLRDLESKGCFDLPSPGGAVLGSL